MYFLLEIQFFYFAIDEYKILFYNAEKRKLYANGGMNMKQKILSALLVFATLFAIALPIKVYADPSDEVVYENLYLISDNHYFFSYESAIVTNLGLNAGLNVNNNIIHIQQLDNPFLRLETIVNDIANNSIVIVDIQERISASNNKPFIEVDKLYNAFWTLKSKNCKTMFISGNDEDTLQNLRSIVPDYLEFLDYVDVHVNDDFNFVLAKAAITKIEELINSSVTGYSIILDAGLRNAQSEKDDFAERWLKPYFEELYQAQYNDYIQDEENINYSDVFAYLYEEKQISIYGQEASNENAFYNYFNNTTRYFNATALDQSLLDLENIFMYGIAKSSQIGSPWHELNNAINESVPEKVFSMVYQTEVMNLDDFNIESLHNVGIGELMFFGLTDPSEDIYTLNEMIADFINNEDMQKYNNMSGRRCSVTYMPMVASPDGWIPSHLILNCLQAYQF